MKTLIVAATAAAAVLAVAGSASAQGLEGTTFYGNLGYSFIDAQDADVNLGAISAKLGARFNPYFGAEVEGAIGVNDDTVNVGVPVKVELTHSIAAYVVGYYPATPSLDLFARLGYGNTEVKASALGASAKDDASDWLVGAGAQYFFTANDGVRGEYTKSGDNGLDANVWSVSYVRKF